MKELAKKGIKKVMISTGKKLKHEYSFFDRKNIKLKSKHEIVTNADMLSEKNIIQFIKKTFPEHSILSEESGLIKNNKKYLWIVDPIDGTTNFSMHNPLWNISIALTEYVSRKKHYEPILGFVYAPMLDEFYFAEKGKGAFLNGKKIAVSRKKKDKTLNAYCHGSGEENIKTAIKYLRNQILKGFDCRRMGSAAIEMAYVAAGRIESFMVPGVNSWDVAAGALLVQEAGGRVTDFSNKTWHTESRDILASNKIVHKTLLKVINS